MTLDMVNCALSSLLFSFGADSC